jgi:hypothetical protein
MTDFEERYSRTYDKLAVNCDTPLDGHLFEMAIAEGHVDAYLRREIELDDLAYEIDGYAATIRLSKETSHENGSSSAPASPIGTRSDHRAHALNAIFAIEAATRNDVEAFRARNLGNELLDLSEVAAWVERSAEADESATVWITVPESELDDATLADQSALSRLPGYSEDTQLLRYVTGGARHTRSIPIHYDGILANLADAAHWIAVRYGWAEAAATTFILTGLPPAAVGIRAKKTGPWPSSKASRRIELDIPLSASSEEVAETFMQLRDKMLGNQTKSRRSLARRTADLAVFAREHSTGHTWEEAMTIWNRQQTEPEGKRYHDKAQFTRDARTAYERVTGEKLDWKRRSPRGTRTPPSNAEED